MISPQIISNEQGLKTLYRADIQETYHSIHGAIAESLHVFMEAGLQRYIDLFEPSKINILEIGFGTGLNAMLSLLFAQEHQLNINYHSYETLPLSYSLIQDLQYQAHWGQEQEHWFVQIHQSPWEENMLINANFSLLKLQQSILLAEPKPGYEIIFFDAFAPDKQPELWSLQVFKKMYKALNPGGILVTYAAKGDVRRSLLEAGFKVEKLAGPPHKRHMLRAQKPLVQ